ncbi:MAG: hypothetical protein K1566_03015 [Candidatus Thiodiazotropha sp. (ex. Lucinisca nassula)]|nr:hypothetical protein [Candidatus Thiodiazotropha sp. (ex. Lucinisca nassula)]
MSNYEAIRYYRNTIYSIADFMVTNENAVSEFGKSLKWSDLEDIPTWLLWDDKEIEQLVMTAGTIFLLPSIRIWIDGKKIQEVRELIGIELFELILNTTRIDNKMIKLLNIDNIKDNLLSAGSAVIISSSSMRIRPWISNSLPKPKGKLSPELASEIIKHTLFVVNQNRYAT